MATNADEEQSDRADDAQIEDDLRKTKEQAEVESPQGTDESATSEDEATQDSEESQEESEEATEIDSAEEPSFVKEFPYIKGDTPEEYQKNLEIAYKNSFAELHRIRTEKATQTNSDSEDELGPTDPRLLYVDRIVNADIQKTYEDFRKDFPQVDDAAQYEKFVSEVADISAYYIEKKGTALTAAELYPRAAANLGWAPQAVDSKDKLGNALKDRASSSKTSSSTKTAPKSKVTDVEIIIAKQTWAQGKSDADIRKELEVYK